MKGEKNMYEKILDSLEVQFKVDYDMNIDYDNLNKIADLIIKIKTIQAMDTSAELVRKGREFQRERGKQ